MPLSDRFCPALSWPPASIEPAANVVEHLCRSATEGRRLLLTGPAGSGRATTLEAFTQAGPAFDFRHLHCAGRAPEEDTPAAVIHHLLAAIRAHLDAPDALPIDEAGLREALPGWLARIAHQRALIVIHQLDRITGTDLTGEPDWLPAYLPPGLTLVASAERGLLPERLREAGWEVVDMNRAPALDQPSEALARCIANDEAAVATLRHLAVAPAGLGHAVLDALGLDPSALPGSVVHEADGLLEFQHPVLRQHAYNQLIQGSADARAVAGRIADAVAPPDEHCLWLARAADWPALLERLSEPTALLAWRDAPFDWQRLWLEIPARDTAVSHLFNQAKRWREAGEMATEQLAECHVIAGRILDALDSADAARAVRSAGLKALARQAPDSPGWAMLAHHHATTDLADDRPDEATRQLRQALAIREGTLGPSSAEARASRHALAAALEANGQLDAAIGEYAALVAECESRTGRDHPALLPLLSNLGAAQRAANQLEQARGPFERCVKIAGQGGRNKTPALAAALDNLGSLLYAGHDYAGAEARYREAFELTQTLFGPGHAATAAALHNLGTALDALEQFQQAQRCFRRAVEIRTAALGREHAETATSLHNLAGVLDVIGQRDEAETLYREAIEIWRAVVGSDHPATATSINNLADLLREQGRLNEAEPLYQENLLLWRSLYGEDHPNTAMTAAELGGLYADAGRADAAEPLLRDAVVRLERMMGIDNGLHVDSLCRLAAMLRQQGRRDEAIALLRNTYQRAAGTTKVLSPRLQKIRRHLDGLEKAAGGNP